MWVKILRSRSRGQYEVQLAFRKANGVAFSTVIILETAGGLMALLSLVEVVAIDPEGSIAEMNYLGENRSYIWSRRPWGEMNIISNSNTL